MPLISVLPLFAALFKYVLHVLCLIVYCFRPMRLVRFGKVDVDVEENANPVSETITSSASQKR